MDPYNENSPVFQDMKTEIERRLSRCDNESWNDHFIVSFAKKVLQFCCDHYNINLTQEKIIWGEACFHLLTTASNKVSDQTANGCYLKAADTLFTDLKGRLRGYRIHRSQKHNVLITIILYLTLEVLPDRGLVQV